MEHDLDAAIDLKIDDVLPPPPKGVEKSISERLSCSTTSRALVSPSSPSQGTKGLNQNPGAAAAWCAEQDSVIRLDQSEQTLAELSEVRRVHVQRCSGCVLCLNIMRRVTKTEAFERTHRTRLETVHFLDTSKETAQTCGIAYEVSDRKYPGSRFHAMARSSERSEDTMWPLGCHIPGMMSYASNDAAKVKWMNAVSNAFNTQQPQSVRFDSGTQTVRFEFTRRWIPSRSDTQALLDAYNEYLVSGRCALESQETRTRDPARGIVNASTPIWSRADIDAGMAELGAEWYGPQLVEWFPSSFVNFPNPPEVDNKFVVKSPRVKRSDLEAWWGLPKRVDVEHPSGKRRPDATYAKGTRKVFLKD